MKSEYRQLLEKVAKQNGRSLIWTNAMAARYVTAGLCVDLTAALKYMVAI